MKDRPTFPPALRSELVRLEVLDEGIRRGLRWEELPDGHWRLSCQTAFRRDSSERMLSDLGRLRDGAGWAAVWEALFSWPESAC